MLFGFLILSVALFISAVAAYYSIAGLTTIFSAAITPIIIMGASLEVGKIITTVWVHKYWTRMSIQFKLYLIPAILVLMLITSMGIFGYLSKAHSDQAAPTGDIMAQVQLFDEKITIERDNIAANKKALAQMDAQVDQLLGRTTDDKGANRAVLIRKNQAAERKSLQDSINVSQSAIIKLQNERAPFAAQVRKVEAEVGPVRYIAALVYGDNPDANLLEHAVRWVIIMLVFVFDPLAIVLILAADQTFIWAKEDKKPKIIDEIVKIDVPVMAVESEPEPEPEPMIGVMEELIEPSVEIIEEKPEIIVDTLVPSSVQLNTDESMDFIMGKVRRRETRISDYSKDIQEQILAQLTYSEKRQLSQ